MTPLRPDLCPDAVIVLPGIMGSELVDAATGAMLWGASPAWYVAAWTTGTPLTALAVTEAERSGHTGRVKATRTLQAPAFMPVWRGCAPYVELLEGVSRTLRDPAAQVEFAYDWRLAIDVNARQLAVCAERHLSTWRAHPKGSRDAKLVLVAHSMGGLVASYFTGVLGGAEQVRATVTLGTPFYGAVKAVDMLSSGRGAPVPLPKARLVTIARTMPGVHDLLPAYKCVDEGASARYLSASDIAALGGDRELAQEAFDRRKRLPEAAPMAPRAVVGVQQPTAQSVRIAHGVAEPLFHICVEGEDGGLERTDRRGDSTVYRDAAAPSGTSPAYLPQSHLGLAMSGEAVTHACAVITETKLGPPLGEEGVGLDLPDVVHVGEQFEIAAVDVADPAAVSGRIEEVGEGYHTRFIAHLHFGDRTPLRARVTLDRPGLYRVQAKAGGASAVCQMLMAVEPSEPCGTDESGRGP